MRLVTLLQFVLEQEKLKEICNVKIEKEQAANSISFKRTVDYARLLKLPLQKGMFLPCDEDGEEVKNPNPKKTSQERFPYELGRYNDAKERVLFNNKLLHGFDGVMARYHNIEGLANLTFGEMEIKKSAIKHWIGFNRIDQ